MVARETLRKLLEVANVRQDPYAVAEAAAGLWELDQGDALAGLNYVRALAALEMGAAARRMMALLGTPEKTDAQDGLRQTLERLPAGLVPWSSRRRRFQANLRALEQRGIATAPLLAAWESPEQNHAARYELHQAGDGNFHIFDTTHASPCKAWLGGLQNFKGAAAGISAEGFQGQLRGPLAFDGLGYGWLIPHILAVSDHSYLNYSPPLYIVEPNLAAVCMVLHLHNWQNWLAGPRLRMFIGADAGGRFFAALRDTPGWTPPTTFVVDPLRPRAALNLQAGVEALCAARAEERCRTRERITAHYAGIDAAAWRQRFADAAAGVGSPLRVLGITTRYSTVLRYSMEELQAVAQAGGMNIQMDICMEPDDQSLEKDYVGMIDRLKPDLLVSISRMRYEIPDLPRNIPALCWDQDNLQCMRDPGALADMKGLTFVAGHGAIFGSFHLNWPISACIFCHPAGMTHRYQPGPATPEEIARFGGDVSYVSHASGTPEQLRDNLRIKWRGATDFLPLFDATCQEVISATRGGRAWEFLELQDLIRRTGIGKNAPPPVVNALLADLRLLVDRVFRHETLGWVARWCASRGKKLKLWGNGWAAHPTLGPWAAGAALPGEQAQAVYRASRINLQIIETGVLHSRLLDGWAAGGFFLIRQAHRTQDEVRIQHHYRMGQLAAAEGIVTLADLARAGPELHELWREIAPEYAAFDRTRVFPGFRIWRTLVPAPVLIPGLEQIMFNDAAAFARLADEYIGSDSARDRAAAGIRQVLLRDLSYDARWRDFIHHIATNIG